jgi:hypothetical protein
VGGCGALFLLEGLYPVPAISLGGIQALIGMMQE